MKKSLKSAVAALMALLLLLVFAACDQQGEQGVQGEAGKNGKSAYELACENGFEGTLEEWLDSLSGADGEKGATGSAGAAGVTPKLQINASTNMWEVSYDNGESWTSLNVQATGNTGATGSTGAAGVTPKLQINATTNMWEVSYDNGATWSSLNVQATGNPGATGSTGAAGVSVENAYVDEYYHLWLELSDGSELDAGYVGPTYMVTFQDHDGTVLYTVADVKHKQSVIAPNDPVREGYTFSGWDKVFDSVTSNLVVTAQYTLATVEAHNQLSFVFEDNGNGTTTATLFMRGDVNLYGLECKMTMDAVGMSFASVSSSASGLLANEQDGVITVSFVAMSGTDVTEEFELLVITFTNDLDVRTAEIAVSDVDIFDDQYQDESYCVAGNTYEN